MDLKKKRLYLAKSNIVVLFLHDHLYWLILFECDEAETSPFVGFVLHGKFDRFHLIASSTKMYCFIAFIKKKKTALHLEELNKISNTPLQRHQNTL